MNQQTRIVIVNDHPLVRAGVRAVVEPVDELAVVGEAASGAEAIALVRETLPHVALLDVSLPDACGLNLVEPIKEASPGTAFVIVTAAPDVQIVRNAVRIGVRSFYSMQSDTDALLGAIRAAVAGRYYVDSPVLGELIYLVSSIPEESLLRSDERYETLSPREREVFRMLAEGMTNKEISYSLGISPKTVETHHARILKKLEICDAVELLRYAARIGVIDVSGWTAS